MPPRRSTTAADEAAGCGIRHGWQSGDRQYAAPAGEYRPQIGQCLLIPGCGEGFLHLPKPLPLAETPLSCRNPSLLPKPLSPAETPPSCRNPSLLPKPLSPAETPPSCRNPARRPKRTADPGKGSAVSLSGCRLPGCGTIPPPRWLPSGAGRPRSEFCSRL